MHIRLAFKVLVFSACVSVCVPCVSVSVTVKLSVKVMMCIHAARKY
jgi:hypothetical protein